MLAFPHFLSPPPPAPISLALSPLCHTHARPSLALAHSLCSPVLSCASLPNLHPLSHCSTASVGRSLAHCPTLWQLGRLSKVASIPKVIYNLKAHFQARFSTGWSKSASNTKLWPTCLIGTRVQKEPCVSHQHRLERERNLPVWGGPIVLERASCHSLKRDERMGSSINLLTLRPSFTNKHQCRESAESLQLPPHWL